MEERTWTRVSFVVVTGALVVASSALAEPPGPRAIVENCESAQRLKDVTAQATIITGDSSGESRSKSFTLWRRLSEDNVHYASVTRFSLPAEIRGEAILFREHPGGENDVQLYLPRFKKVRRVESSSQSSSFMGSALSYSDIAPPHVDDYNHKLLKTEACPGEAAATQCYVVEKIPKTDAVAVSTGYSRNVQWIRVDNFMVVQSEGFDKSGRLWKRLLASDIREVDKVGHKWFTHLLRVEDLLAKRFTTFKLEQVKANTGLSPQLFTEQNLARD